MQLEKLAARAAFTPVVSRRLNIDWICNATVFRSPLPVRLYRYSLSNLLAITEVGIPAPPRGPECASRWRFLQPSQWDTLASAASGVSQRQGM